MSLNPSPRNPEMFFFIIIICAVSADRQSHIPIFQIKQFFQKEQSDTVMLIQIWILSAVSHNSEEIRSFDSGLYTAIILILRFYISTS